MESFPRLPLCLLPTPLHRLDRASTALGIDLWIKRDDLTGFAMGGNKGRKLEFLVADALATGATAVVTCGAAQSNFVRQLGAACAVAGLPLHVAAMALPYEEAPPPGARPAKGGNVLLDGLFGVDLRVGPDGTWDELFARMESLAREIEATGERVYRIPVGGSSPLGVRAFELAAEEIGPEWDAIVFASSSGSTHTGLMRAFRGSRTRIVGVACDPEPAIAEEFAALGNGLDRRLGLPESHSPEEYHLDFRHVGPGYGVPSTEGDDAVRWFARTEGILLDPIYTGKAFAGLRRMVAEGSVGGRVLFWHTGGLPALFVEAAPEPTY